MSAYQECAASICDASCRCHYRAPTASYCDWCGRAIKQQDGQWIAVKGVERGYDPVPCDANTDDGTHEPAANESSSP